MRKETKEEKLESLGRIAEFSEQYKDKIPVLDDLVHRPEEHGVMRRITPELKPRPKKAKAVYPATMKVVFELINDVVIDYESITVKNIETKELTIYNYGNHDELRNISPETHEAISIDLGKTVLYIETKIY